MNCAIHLFSLPKNFYSFPMLLFPQSSLLLSEFDKIKLHIANHCLCSLGKTQVEQIAPSSDFEKIKTSLQKNAEFIKLHTSGENFPSQNYKDLTKEIALLQIENSVLQSAQFLEIFLFAKTTESIFNFFKNHESVYLNLKSIVAELKFEKQIIKLIEEILDEHGNIRSNASEALVHIRKSLTRSRHECDRLYNSVIGRYRKDGWLADTQESTRNGRRVLSIVAEQKRMSKGIVHDVSATGKTVFIEPEEVIEMNNLVFSLEQDERLEIQRVLRELTDKLRQFTPVLKKYQAIIGEFDFVRANALFALQINAHVPFIENKPYINLRNARHPLLILHNKDLRKQTVPFSLRLDGVNKILVISGPNAGGKTVCLKTIGLLQLMLQSGMPVPCDDNSVMGIFTTLLTDIGDSQSIEYELSTYSSRLQHMKVFLDKSNEKTLFLIDEFGSGTDPDLGGALAEAVLEQLHKQQAFGIITTHYMNLKVFADRTKGVVNGMMGFDSKNLKPLFHLQVGKPGSSFTFVVAERSGISHQLVNNAKQKVDRKHLLLEQLLNKVENEKSFVAKKADEIRTKEKKLNDLMTTGEKIIFENEQLKNSIEERIKKKEHQIITQYEQQLKHFSRELGKAKNKKPVIDKFLEQLGVKKSGLQAKQKAERVINPLIKKGSLVKLFNGKISGIVSEINGSKARVLFENTKTTCALADLVLVEKE